jgi:3-dehydroquinate dehydratase-1
MKKIKICSVVVGSNLKGFLSNLDKVQEISEMVELRIDQIKNLTERDLKIIQERTKKNAILTCRTKNILLKALDLGFDYIDIDLDSVEKDNIIFPKNSKTKIIISFHDFQKTPSEEFLYKLISKMNEYHPNIIKIATLITKHSDNIKLLRLVLDNRITKNKIIIGMGKQGKITRILGPILGNYLTYASTDWGKSAQGQIDIIKLKKIYKLIN